MQSMPNVWNLSRCMGITLRNEKTAYAFTLKIESRCRSVAKIIGGAQTVGAGVQTVGSVLSKPLRKILHRICFPYQRFDVIHGIMMNWKKERKKTFFLHFTIWKDGIIITKRNSELFAKSNPLNGICDGCLMIYNTTFLIVGFFFWCFENRWK